MKLKKIATIRAGQDGAIHNRTLYRLDEKGVCSVYDLSALAEGGAPIPRGSFTLGSADRLTPHSNATCFGTEYYAEGDELPLLYTNVYNNCAGQADRRIGECCVYRILREGEGYRADLVQLIAIGFCEDSALWRASPEGHGVRPYGNFLVDPDTRSYYAYVMRNEALGTRFFRFDLPTVHEGELDPTLGVRRVVLGEGDIRDRFDLPFYRFIQGGIVYGGRLYSTEGFAHSEENPAAIRVVDPSAHREEYHSLVALGIGEEPEMIDFMDGVCYYSDGLGNLYTADFEA